MTDHIVVDVEIQKAVGEGGLTWDDTDQLGVACAVVFEYRTNRFRIFGPNDLEALRKRLEMADRISGYNIWKFDFPVIYALPGRERVVALKEKTNDLLVRIWEGLGLSADTFSDAHKGWGLDVVARGTLGAGKIGYGGDAPKWFQTGDWARVANYCADDVALERDLTSFIDRFHYVVNGNTGQVVHL
jgi:DEAD/DEAH box helicase domain-containing protein